MVFIITSPFPFHFLYKLVQVTCCVPERADQRQPAELHLQNRSLWSSFIPPYSAFPFLCLPPAHPFIFSSFSLLSALLPFSLSPIFDFTLLSFFFFFFCSYHSFLLIIPFSFYLFFIFSLASFSTWYLPLTTYYPISTLGILLLFCNFWLI